MSDELDNFFAALPERAAAKDLSGIRTTYVFEVESGDAWTVRIEGGKVEVEPGAGTSADCTISASEETFSKLIKSELGAFSAYLSGKLKLSGDLGAAVQLQKLIS